MIFVADPAADDAFPATSVAASAAIRRARCSLRAAIQEANVHAADAADRASGGDPTARRHRCPRSTATWRSSARARAQTAIDAGGKSRALQTSSGKVTISDLTLTGGVLTTGPGAGLPNDGADLTLARVAVVGNVASPPGRRARRRHRQRERALTSSRAWSAGNRAEPGGAGADGDAVGGGIASDGR